MIDALLTASRILVAVSARSIDAVEHSITIPQFRVLVLLDIYDELQLKELAKELDVNPSTAMRMADKLFEGTYVTRSSPKDKGRVTRYALTDRGRRIVREALTIRRQEIARILDALPVIQQQQLFEALEAFAASAGEPYVAFPQEVHSR